ncbi:hypothetical protein GGF32_002132, partial [Allomyces javanicus]
MAGLQFNPADPLHELVVLFLVIHLIGIVLLWLSVLSIVKALRRSRTRFWIASLVGCLCLAPAEPVEICFGLFTLSNYTLFTWTRWHSFVGDLSLRVGVAILFACRFYRLKIIGPLDMQRYFAPVTAVVWFMALFSLACVAEVRALETEYMRTHTAPPGFTTARHLESSVTFVAFVVTNGATLAMDVAFAAVILNNAQSMQTSVSTRPSSARNSVVGAESQTGETTSASVLRSVPESSGKKAVSAFDETSVVQQRRRSLHIQVLVSLAPAMLIQVINFVTLFYALTEGDFGGPGMYANITLCRFAATLEAFTLYYVSIPMTKHLVTRHRMAILFACRYYRLKIIGPRNIQRYFVPITAVVWFMLLFSLACVAQVRALEVDFYCTLIATPSFVTARHLESSVTFAAFLITNLSTLVIDVAFMAITLKNAHSMQPPMSTRPVSARKSLVVLSDNVRVLASLTPAMLIQVASLGALAYAHTEPLFGGPGMYVNNTLCRFAVTLEAFTLYYVSIPMTKHLVKRHKTGAGTR